MDSGVALSLLEDRVKEYISRRLSLLGDRSKWFSLLRGSSVEGYVHLWTKKQVPVGHQETGRKSKKHVTRTCQEAGRVGSQKKGGGKSEVGRWEVRREMGSQKKDGGKYGT